MKSFLFMTAGVLSQCTPDVLVDDFKVANQSLLVIETPPPLRYFNLLHGDYGSKPMNISVNTEGQYMEINPIWGEEDTSENATHPGAPVSHNYWYVKFDPLACFDLTPFSAIQFDLLAPADAEMMFTLTQHAADCKTRLIDSAYTSLRNYTIPDGTKKTVTIPLSDFKNNLLGEPFDFTHLKDFTIINLVPAGYTFQLSNFILKGGVCASALPGSGGMNGTTPTTSGKSTTTTTPTVTPTGSANAIFGSLWVCLFLASLWL